VRELLAAGAPLRCVDGGRWTALHHACLQGDARAVAALLEADVAGATVDARNSEGNSALILASFKGCEGAVSALLARGARQDFQDSGGKTALHWAADRGFASVVELLCAAPGARVDAVDSKGRTPLILASLEGPEGAVRALLARGARQELRGGDGRTALHNAAFGGYARVVELLCAAPGAPVDAQDSDGWSPLMIAGRNGHEGAVRALLAAGARQELQDSRGEAVLHHASRSGHASVVELLCSAPGAAAALALRDKAGRSPLAALRRFGSFGELAARQAACAAVLRAHGAS
jgi:cytohesin